jgi:hypothetical protein
MNYQMTDADISKALKAKCYLNEGQGTYAGFRDLLPLLLVLRYKAMHSTKVYETAEEPKRAIIYPSYWLR